MSLTTDKKKRNSLKCIPSSTEHKTPIRKRIFVIQRHKSSVLHYDLRLEVNGTLKSWAVPKGPSMNIQDKRLAIRTQDHPMEYASVKGIIPEGTYGAGIVEIWDKGTFIPHGIGQNGSAERQLLKQLREGRIKFTLRGRKLRGVFTLLRLHENGSETWILIKGNDKYAVSYAYDSEALTSRTSLINKHLRQSTGTMYAGPPSNRTRTYNGLNR